MITIKVRESDECREFSIHEALLIARSEFFKNAMNGDWKEAEEKLIKLPEDDPDTFALYEQLVYTGCVPAFGEFTDRVFRCFDKSTVCNQKDVCEAEYTSLARLYVLAEKLQDIEAKNASVRALISKVNHEGQHIDDIDLGPCLPSLTTIKTIYEGTTKDCPGRRALQDCYVWYGQENSLDEITDGKQLPREFLYDLAVAGLAYRQQPSNGMSDQDLWRYDEDKDGIWGGCEGYLDLVCYRNS
jgi:hypothetical protein